MINYDFIYTASSAAQRTHFPKMHKYEMVADVRVQTHGCFKIPSQQVPKESEEMCTTYLTPSNHADIQTVDI